MIELTIDERRFVLHLLDQLQIKPTAGDAVAMVQMVQAIAEKLKVESTT